jgi:hypothetical protein
MNSDDQAKLGDLAMRSIDTILKDYGEDSVLVAATLIFVVRVPDTHDPTDDLFHVNYRSLEGSSPMHIAGLAHSMAAHLFSPASDET